MAQKWPSVQVTHSANVGLIWIGLFPFGAAFLPALPSGDGVVLAPLRPHLLRPRKVLRGGNYPLDGLGNGLDEERRYAHLPLPLAGLVPGPRPPRDCPSGNSRPNLIQETRGHAPDLDSMPYDSWNMLKLIRTGDISGVRGFDSPFAKKWLKRMLH